MLEILIPVYVGETNAHRDLDRVVCLTESLSSNFVDDCCLTVNVLTPRRDLALLELRLSRTQSQMMQFRFWADEDLIGPGIPNGWVKQQLLKLTLAAKISSDFVLILDSDILAVRQFRISDLFVDGRCLNGWEGKNLHGWHKSSCRLLDVPFDDGGYAISVTPEILAVPVCIQLTKYLADIYGHHWPAALWKLHRDGLDWSEYSLYNAFAEKIGALRQYHLSPEELFKLPVRLTSAMSHWSAESFNSSNLREILRPAGPVGFFNVLQSTSNISPALACAYGVRAQRIQDMAGSVGV